MSIMTMVLAMVNDVPRSARPSLSKTDASFSQKKPRVVRGFEVFKQGGVKQSDLGHSEQSGQGLRFQEISLIPYLILNAHASDGTIPGFFPPQERKNESAALFDARFD